MQESVFKRAKHNNTDETSLINKEISFKNLDSLQMMLLNESAQDIEGGSGYKPMG